MLHFAYIPGGISSKSECKATKIEIAGYSYINAYPIDEFWRLDGVTKKHGVWKGYCSFEYDAGYGDIYVTPPKPQDKGTEDGAVEIGAAAATAYIPYSRTVAKAYRKNFLGTIIKKNVWAGVHP
jgi:hypothetical protein